MGASVTRKIQQFYSRFQGDDTVLIVIVADPDAIASAMAVKRLLWRKVANVTISHINTIKRPDNLAMIRLLGVDIFHTKDIDETVHLRFHAFCEVAQWVMQPRRRFERQFAACAFSETKRDLL